jgi:hypothetical protein
MFLSCPNCSNEIKEDWLICARCGEPLEGEKELLQVEAQIQNWRAREKAKRPELAKPAGPKPRSDGTKHTTSDPATTSS